MPTFIGSDIPDPVPIGFSDTSTNDEIPMSVIPNLPDDTSFNQSRYGLVNIGNSCFVNSLLQSLFAIPLYREKLTVSFHCFIIVKLMSSCSIYYNAVFPFTSIVLCQFFVLLVY
eukprot:TRINITY_DN444_c0_g1_i16.p1 TRINITY_DN444_c0_g1~~TRINITY_DN444_c0_g1_i16.p1  ORF type:complete len:114 (-),score=6.24 TRINITY_DN444_c0_g1_i16:166-507(-)